ncbi:conserved hypothetical protein [Planktothrix serta PCC 8927]|uniref:DUF1822 family protein n=1 Tax=Planktothrix serta PCC 8927 TaxID=671068 RepID=A0A7Z9BX52_9CYAN|nr:DUF1822 family protein [Planktothrix serta]VXD24372.1 conserved hypothetical protein [Planktothrix serta PCC 8927]
MVNQRFNLEDYALPMIISQQARDIATQFALRHPKGGKREQVYLNTLAVWGVHCYLEWMQIATELEASDSWNPIIQLCANVADLQITGVGRLECRPVREKQQIVSIPPEVQIDRIGYVVVRIFDNLKTAEILGFVKTITQEILPLAQLQPIEELLVNLNAPQRAEFKTPVRLSLWLIDEWEGLWQSISRQPALGLRSLSRGDEDFIQGAKLIDLKMQLGSQSVVLWVALTPETEGQIAVRVRLYPATPDRYLPPNIQLILLSETGKILSEVQSRFQDNYIQLPRFRGMPEEQFSITVRLGEASITERFIF